MDFLVSIFPPVCFSLSLSFQQPGIGGTWEVGSQNRVYLRVNCWHSTYTRCSVLFENVFMISTFFISLNEYGWMSEWNWTSGGEFNHSTSSRHGRLRPTCFFSYEDEKFAHSMHWNESFAVWACENVEQKRLRLAVSWWMRDVANRNSIILFNWIF